MGPPFGSAAEWGTRLACIRLGWWGKSLPTGSLNPPKGKETHMTRLIAPSAVAALLTAALLTPPPAARAEYKHGLLTATKLVKHASDYYGKTVTVKAKVDDVMGTNMFSLDEDALFAGPDVLVIVPAGVSNVAHDQKVVVTGEVRAYVESDLDRDFKFFEDGKLI